MLPVADLALPPDVYEQIQLLYRRSKQSRLYIDPDDEKIRLRIFSFLDDFESGHPPDPAELESVFVDRIGIRSATDCRAEIELLEEQIYNQDEGSGSDSDPAILGGVVALTRYCRFLLFGFESEVRRSECKTMKKRSLTLGDASPSMTAPKDFCCPISLDLMRDPVVVSTGQTYERDSITQWIGDGHGTCPNSGQVLAHTQLVPNLAIRSLITQWCAARGIPYDTPDGPDVSAECMAAASAGKAAVQANRATAEVLVRELSGGSLDTKSIAARELRLLAKTGKENRACIAEAGAIPLLQRLLCSDDSAAQENSVTAILNLSIHDCNKSRVMESEGCLRSIVDVLRSGWTTEARENAAATLFSLSAVHDYKKRIADESGAVESLAEMLRDGRLRGKKDAVTALFNLSTHPECCQTMVDSGAVFALVGALEVEGVAEDAAGALGLLVRRPVVAELITSEDSVVTGLVGLMRRGSLRGKENAVAALHEMCRSGGVALTQRVARTPALGGLIQTLLFSGTKRARRKAASLARMCQRSIAMAATATETSFAGGWGMEYALARSTSVRRGSSFVVGGSDVSVTVAISVPVL